MKNFIMLKLDDFQPQQPQVTWLWEFLDKQRGTDKIQYCDKLDEVFDNWSQEHLNQPKEMPNFCKSLFIKLQKLGGVKIQNKSICGVDIVGINKSYLLLLLQKENDNTSLFKCFTEVKKVKELLNRIEITYQGEKIYGCN